MKLMLTAFFLSISVEASPLFFELSQLSGTENMANVSKAEFLFDQTSSSIRHCGFWEFRDGTKKKFEMIWNLEGSVVKKSGKPLGSYYDGNLMLEDIGENRKALSLEVTRFNETFFEYHYHHPDFGFVDGDGWLVESPSAVLEENCVSQ